LGGLRILGAVGNILFLGGLAALGTSSGASGRLLGVFGLVLVACHPAVLPFLAEFRIDGWGYALIVWSIVRFRRLPRGEYRNFEFGLLTGVASLLFCPKLALLPPLIVLSAPLIGWASVRGCLRSVAAYLLGTSVAAGLFAAYLAWNGIDLDRAFEVLVRYNAISNANLGLRHGLLQGLLDFPVLSSAVLVGVVVWVVDLYRRRSRPDPYKAALAVWLAMQPFLVAYPYKQYYAPWFLLASGFLVYPLRVLSNVLGRARVAAMLAACAATAAVDLQAARNWSEIGATRADQRLIRWMNRVTRAEDRVVASPPLHPIDRRDSFFLWFNTLAPGGFDAEQIVARLPMYRRYVREGQFLRELEAHPPALVVVSGDWRIVPYTEGQRQALAGFLRARGYAAVRVGEAWFALRPDRYERASREGLLGP
jgi:hypothetical protein